ncbi:MAG: TonB family protein [Pseudomonadota bacterium]
MKSRFFTRCALPLLLLVMAGPTLADVRADFDRSYAIYQKYYGAGEWEQATTAASEVLYFATRAFGKTSINTANMAFNYARLLNRAERYDESLPLLDQAMDVLRAFHGPASAELVEPYLELGKARWSTGRESNGIAAFRRAVHLAGLQSRAEKARLNMVVGVFLSNRMFSVAARLFLQDAMQQYQAEVGDADVRVAFAALHIGRGLVFDDSYSPAMPLLEQALGVFVADERNLQLELATRKLLVQALEGLGRSDEATEHCLVVGRKSMSDQHILIGTVEPNYPVDAVEQMENGWVVVEFTVNEEGFVRDPVVAETTSTLFNAAAIEAASRFRFAPRFQDGKPIATPGVRNKISFHIVDQLGPGKPQGDI